MFFFVGNLNIYQIQNAVNSIIKIVLIIFVCNASGGKYSSIRPFILSMVELFGTFTILVAWKFELGGRPNKQAGVGTYVRTYFSHGHLT